MNEHNTCSTCDYYRAGVNGLAAHGTCHIDPPGNSVRNGFPMVAATDWCAQGVTVGASWIMPQEQPALLRIIEVLHAERKEAASERAALGVEVNLWIGRAGELLARNLWQRICNTVPWSDK